MLADTHDGEPRLNRVIPLKEASRIASLSVDAIKRRNRAGLIKLVRLSVNRLGIFEDELARFLKERER